MPTPSFSLGLPGRLFGGLQVPSHPTQAHDSGGWMYVTSRDNHDLHDLCMIIYLILNVPWMYFSTYHSTNAKTRRRR